VKTDIIILYCLISLLSGLITGLIISVLYYPKWEVKKILKQQKKEGFKFGEWNHFKTLVDHNFKDIVKPNCETLYSVSFIQRKDGPYILQMPPFDSYFSFAFLNNNTDVLGYITNRDANEKMNSLFLISYDKKEFESLKLPGIILDSKICWIIGRFAVNNPAEISLINKTQNSVQLTKLKDYINGKSKKD